MDNKTLANLFRGIAESMYAAADALTEDRSQVIATEKPAKEIAPTQPEPVPTQPEPLPVAVGMTRDAFRAATKKMMTDCAPGTLQPIMPSLLARHAPTGGGLLSIPEDRFQPFLDDLAGEIARVVQ